MTFTELIRIHEASHAVASFKLSRIGGKVVCGSGNEPISTADGIEAFGMAGSNAQGWRESVVVSMAGAIGAAILADVDLPFEDYISTRDQAFWQRLAIRDRKNRPTPPPDVTPQQSTEPPRPMPDIDPDRLASEIHRTAGYDAVSIIDLLDTHATATDPLETIWARSDAFYELRQQAIDLCSVNADAIRTLADHLGDHHELDGDQVRAFLYEHETRAAVMGMVDAGRITATDATAILDGLHGPARG